MEDVDPIRLAGPGTYLLILICNTFMHSALIMACPSNYHIVVRCTALSAIIQGLGIFHIVHTRGPDLSHPEGGFQCNFSNFTYTYRQNVFDAWRWRLRYSKVASLRVYLFVVYCGGTSLIGLKDFYAALWLWLHSIGQNLSWNMPARLTELSEWLCDSYYDVLKLFWIRRFAKQNTVLKFLSYG